VDVVFNLGTTTVTWTVTDGSGNTDVCSFDVIVEDNQDPTFTVPSDITICRATDCTYVADPSVTGDVTDEWDNCATDIEAIYSDNTDNLTSCDIAGYIIRTWSLDDGNGNIVTQEQIIWINPVPSLEINPVVNELCYQAIAEFGITTPNTLTPGSQWRYQVDITYPANVSGQHGAAGSTPTVVTPWITDLADIADFIDNNLQNTSQVAGTVIYTFRPEIRLPDGTTTCTGIPVTNVQIHVNPQPIINVVPQEDELCFEGTVDFDISTPNISLSTGALWKYDIKINYPQDVDGSFGNAGDEIIFTGLTGVGIAEFSDDLVNSGDIVRTVQYTFTPYIVLSDGTTICPGIEMPVSIEINPQPVIDVAPQDDVLCFDGVVDFDIETVNIAVSEGAQWRYDVRITYPEDVSGTFGGDDQIVIETGLTATGIASFTDDLLNSGDIVRTITYQFTPYIVLSDGLTVCAGVPSQIIDIIINPQPKVVATTDIVLCFDGDAVFDVTNPNTVNTTGTWLYDVTVSYPAGVTGNWSTGLTDQTAAGIAALTDNLANSTDNVQTVTYTFTPKIDRGGGRPVCGNGVPLIIEIEINPQPKIVATTDMVLCFDGDAVFDIINPNTVNTTGTWLYDVSVNYPAGVTGSWSTGLTDQTAAGIAALTDNLANSTDNVQTVTYTFTPKIDRGGGRPVCGNGVPVIIEIEINPQPKIVATTDLVLCFDGDAVFDITNPNTVNATGTWLYDVSVNYPAGVTGSWSAGLTGQTVTGIAALTDNLANSTDNVQTVTYTFTPKIDRGGGRPVCGNGVPVIIEIEINPQPKIVATTDLVLCFDGDAVFDIANPNTVNTTGTWLYDVTVSYPAGVTGSWSTGLTDQTAAGIAALTDNLANSTDNVQTVTYTFTPKIDRGGGRPVCGNGVPLIIEIEINPQPKIVATTDMVLCFDGDAVFDIINPNTVNTTGTWLYDVSVNYPAGVTGNWSAGLTGQSVTGIAALTDNLANSTDNVQTVTYTFTPRIDRGGGRPVCENGVPVIIEIEINPQPKIQVAGIEDVLCFDGVAEFDIINPNTVNTTGTWLYDVSVNYPAGVTGSWSTGLTNQTAAGIAALTDNLANSTDNVQTVTYTFTPKIDRGGGRPVCGNGVPVIIEIEINPQPKIVATTDMVLCFDGDAVFDVTNLNTVNTTGTWLYDVTVSYPAGVTGNWSTGLTNQTVTGIAALTDNLANSTDNVQTVTYTFTPRIDRGGGRTVCENGVPVIIEIEINPQPKIQVAGIEDVLCFDGVAEFDITNLNTVNTGGTWLYDVTVSYPAGVTGNWSTGLVNQTDLNITDDLENTTTNVQTVTYTFTPKIDRGGGRAVCENGVPVTIDIIINPQPRIQVAEEEDVLCFDGVAEFEVTNPNTINPAGEWRYDLQVTYPAGVTGSIGPGTGTVLISDLTDIGPLAITDNLENITAEIQTVTYTFTPKIDRGGGRAVCEDGISRTIIISINPRPQLEVFIQETIICDSASIVIEVNDLLGNVQGSKVYQLITTNAGGNVAGVQPSGEYTAGLDISNQLFNQTNEVQTVTYNFRARIKDPQGNGSYCDNGTDTTITIYVNPTPVMTVSIDETVYCDLSEITFEITDLNGTVLGEKIYTLTTTYQNEMVEGVQPDGEYERVSFSNNLQNLSNEVQTIIYHFKAKIKDYRGADSGYCNEGGDFTYTLYLNPTPVVTSSLLNDRDTICTNTFANFELTSLTSVYTGVITFDYVAVPSGNPGDITGFIQSASNLPQGTRVNRKLENHTNIPQYLTYTVTPYAHSTGCAPGIPTDVVIRINPTPIDSFYISKDIECYGAYSGSLALETATGSGPYEIVWTGPDGFVSNQRTLDNIGFGRYNLRVTDANNCAAVGSIRLSNPDPIAVNFTHTHVSCFGGSDGQIQIATLREGGGPPYSFHWTGPEGFIFEDNTTQHQRGLIAGQYVVVITDVNGCQYSSADFDPLNILRLYEPVPMTIEIETRDAACDINNDGSAGSNVSGGTTPYTYLWEGPAGYVFENNTTPDIGNLTGGLIRCGLPMQRAVFHLFRQK
jgi:hypothetical protein